MHEYALAQNIIETAAGYAGDARVKKINLVIGASAGVVFDSIQLYFDIVSKNTACEKAVLETENVVPMLSCGECGLLFERKPFQFECPCGGEGRPTGIGREFYIKSIEVEHE